MKLYRAVSEAEFQDLNLTGKFREVSNSLEGKWFAETAEDAAQWGNAMEWPGNYRVIEVDVPAQIAEKLFRLDWLDNIGPALYAEIYQLGNATFREVII